MTDITAKIIEAGEYTDEPNASDNTAVDIKPGEHFELAPLLLLGVVTLVFQGGVKLDVARGALIGEEEPDARPADRLQLVISGQQTCFDGEHLLELPGLIGTDTLVQHERWGDLPLVAVILTKADKPEN